MVSSKVTWSKVKSPEAIRLFTDLLDLWVQPRYVVNRVAAGDYECAERSAEMLRELGAAFRLLNLRNDFLRKRFDGT